ncbi:hypothetical protein NEOLEDRAFT_258358 [Neolentinus lepideus HHB14362 ss-1]|uniref:Uncharacterized protein n=1 Tax=Neolentinus lepideus HHB14362 ss-1 TaxID=1314782 RepID=A0A165TB84_9AGAM|nr:hypothetical protein NEOLEDRAFT_258358 [Neolentinus lepideus HHB14362 ss-1]
MRSTDRISRAQSLQFLPGRQPEDTIVSHTSIATQTIVTDVNHASLTSSEGHTASTGPILVQGSTADAIVSCLMEKLQEINNGLEERTGQCEDMFEKLQLLKLLTEITRYLRLSEFEQRSNASHATASADSDIRTTQDTSTKLEMFAEKMKSIETLEHANLAKIKALEENSKDMEKRFRVFETGISSRHAELASQPGQFCQFHVLGTVHALGSDQTHPAQHEVSLHANPRGPSNRGRQYSWTDNRGAGAPYSRKQSDGQSSNQPYYHNGRSNTYSQRRSGPPTGPRYRAGERQSQYHRNQHYHHHRDVNKPSRCGRDEYNDGLVRSRVDDPKNCQQHATASRSRSTSIVQLNSQQDGRTHEQPEEQGAMLIKSLF